MSYRMRNGYLAAMAFPQAEKGVRLYPGRPCEAASIYYPKTKLNDIDLW